MSEEQPQQPTPGPWEWGPPPWWHEGYRGDTAGDLKAADGTTVLATDHDGEGVTWIEVSSADRRLIASAPDLLAACYAVLEESLHAGTQDQLLAAVAKATGNRA